MRVRAHWPDDGLGTDHRKKEYEEHYKDKRPECDWHAPDETLNQEVERLEELYKPHRTQQAQQTQEAQTTRIRKIVVLIHQQKGELTNQPHRDDTRVEDDPTIAQRREGRTDALAPNSSMLFLTSILTFG